MTTIKNFEDLRCWQTARELCQLIYKFTRKEKFSKDFSLVNQIRNSSGSAMDNIAEGFDRAGNKEFIQFLAVSRGSTSEVKSQLNRALNQEYINDNEFKQAYDLANQTSKEITNFILYLKKSNLKGFKFS
jgi:four helix bundle protein